MTDVKTIAVAMVLCLAAGFLCGWLATRTTEADYREQIEELNGSLIAAQESAGRAEASAAAGREELGAATGAIESLEGRLAEIEGRNERSIGHALEIAESLRRSADGDSEIDRIIGELAEHFEWYAEQLSGGTQAVENDGGN